MTVERQLLGLICHQCLWELNPGEGTHLCPGRGVQPGFPKCRACELIFTCEKGVL